MNTIKTTGVDIDMNMIEKIARNTYPTYKTVRFSDSVSLLHTEGLETIDDFFHHPGIHISNIQLAFSPAVIHHVHLTLAHPSPPNEEVFLRALLYDSRGILVGEGSAEVPEGWYSVMETDEEKEL